MLTAEKTQAGGAGGWPAAGGRPDLPHRSSQKSKDSEIRLSLQAGPWQSGGMVRAAELPKPELPELRIFQPSGLAVTVGFTEALTPAAQVIINRVMPKVK